MGHRPQWLPGPGPLPRPPERHFRIPRLCSGVSPDGCHLTSPFALRSDHTLTFTAKVLLPQPCVTSTSLAWLPCLRCTEALGDTSCLLEKAALSLRPPRCPHVPEAGRRHWGCCGVQSWEGATTRNQNLEALGSHGGWLLPAAGWGQKKHDGFPRKSNQWHLELRELRGSAKSQEGTWSSHGPAWVPGM